MRHKNVICYSCCEKKALTEEHIIPQALGGILSDWIYCKKCNETFGSGIDAELIRRLGYIGTSLNVKREKGKHQPFDLSIVGKEIGMEFDGKSLSRKKPIVIIEKDEVGKIKYIDVTARTEDELKNIIYNITKKYELDGDVKIFCEKKLGPTDTVTNFIFDNTLIRRSVSKIAYGLLCTKLPLKYIMSNSFDKIRQYIRYGLTNDLATANFVHAKFMSDYIRPNHKIHICLNRGSKLVVGFVCIFGIFKYTVLMSDSYSSTFEWPGLDYTYNPITQKEVLGNPNFRAPRLTIKQILSPKHTKDIVARDLEKGHNMLNNYLTDHRFMEID